MNCFFPCWTHVHFWGHPCFRLLVMYPLGFKARVGSALLVLAEGVREIRSLRFTSGATLLPMYMASMAAGRFPHMHVSAEVECWISSCKTDIPVYLLSD